MRTRRGVEQWKLVGLITRRSLVQIQPPLPSIHKASQIWPAFLFVLYYGVLLNIRKTLPHAIRVLLRSFFLRDFLPLGQLIYTLGLTFVLIL